MKRFHIVITLLCLIFVNPMALATQKRVALVIGNSNYENSPLKNPVNDASDMASKLKNFGFDVVKLINADKRNFEKGIRVFGKKLHQTGTIGLFYFAGHGLQVKNQNYLVPIGANIEDESDVKYETINIGRVLEKMDYAKNGLNLVILDACRNNPFTRSFRSGARGLTLVRPATGTLILYATEPGSVAADGSGRNGLFTEKLMMAMSKSGIKVQDVFQNTANAVNQSSQGKQTPWSEGTIIGNNFYFTERKTKKIAPKKASITVKATTTEPFNSAARHEITFWNSVDKMPTAEGYKAYLQQYPSGHYKALALIKIKQLTKVATVDDMTPVVKTKTKTKTIKPAKTVVTPKVKKQAKAKEVSKPKPIAHLSQLTIHSNVHNDKVKINGEFKGSTKLQLSLKAGEYLVEITKVGYQPYKQKIYLEKSANKMIKAKLKKKVKVRAVNLADYGIDMVAIRGGTFQMGSPTNEKGRDDDELIHQVSIQDFKINRTEVKLEDFEKFIQATAYITDAEKNAGAQKGCYSLVGKKWQYVEGHNYRNPGFEQGKNHPVVCVSHNDSLAYISWLNKKTSKKFRLPTEAEWEYAARGGKTTEWFWGSKANDACDYENVADKMTKKNVKGYVWRTHDCNDAYTYTSPVGAYKNNPYGLYDMLGNVWEWTCSKWSIAYKGQEKICHKSAKIYSFRGGSWYNVSAKIRVANRNRYRAFDRFFFNGFRLVQAK